MKMNLGTWDSKLSTHNVNINMIARRDHENIINVFFKRTL